MFFCVCSSRCDSACSEISSHAVTASHAGNSSEVSVVQMDGGGGQGSEYGRHDPTATLQAAAAAGLLSPAPTDHIGYPAVEGLAIDAGG